MPKSVSYVLSENVNYVMALYIIFLGGENDASRREHCEPGPAALYRVRRVVDVILRRGIILGY